MTINKISSFVFPPPEPQIPSKQNLKMNVFQSLVNRYIEATAPYWESMPEIYLTNITLLSNGSRKTKDTLVRLLNAFLVTLKKQTRKPEIPSCDVILCYSTPKSIWQYPMQTLAERLSKRGFRVALLNSRRLEIIEYKQDKREFQYQEISGFVKYRASSNSFFKDGLNIFRSLNHVILLYRILKKDKSLRAELYRNPFLIWLEFFIGNQNLDIADKFIQQLKPQLIVSNHIILPFSSELLAVSESKDIYRIWFCNENPGGIHIAANICDEIWCWNQMHLDSQRLMLRPGADIQMEISGHAETDVAIKNSREQLPVTEEEAEFIAKTRGRKVLLYLSTYYPAANRIGLDSNNVSRELAEWMEYVSTRHPDWFFIFKDRPARFGEEVPGFDRIKKLSNWLFPQSEINFLNFLKWDNLKLVAADSSLGLITAAGMNKLPVWLSAPSQEDHFLPNVEQVSLRVFSAETFDHILTNIDTLLPAYKEWLGGKQDEIFPNRGTVLDHMEELCVRRLSTSN